ncbi:U3 snoRNP protein [Clonorchis sinensis]|uniref:U3 snoRNP protein n=1 Tax=Clonorchis sinensis TaxID=79923 RepID=A0A8T1MJ65_CLOSI|nr:U3 snoRNP protein [Clonorchis sinensis]
MLRFKRGTDASEFQIVNTGAATQSKKRKSTTRKQRDSATVPQSSPKKLLKPVWNDEEDVVSTEFSRPPAVLDVNARLRLSGDVTNSNALCELSDDQLVSCTTKILREEKSTGLPSGKTIAIRRVFDANRERISMGALSAVHFNPVYQMSLTASVDSTLAFFKVDGTENALLRDRVFEKYPLSSAKFIPSGTRVVLTGNRNSFRIYDLETGLETRASPFIGSRSDEILVNCEMSSGHPNIVGLGTTDKQVYLADLRSLEKVAVLRTKGTLQSFTFLDDGTFVHTFDANGFVYVFDVRGRKPQFVHQWCDQACTGGTRIASSVNSSWIACGSDCGFVNVYQMTQTMMSSNPVPDKSIANVQTAIDSMAFHPASEMLCLGSSQMPAAVRLYHLYGHQVFDNFPVCVGRLGKPTSIAFSPGGGYLCVGQSNGRAALYHISHYIDY